MPVTVDYPPASNRVPGVVPRAVTLPELDVLRAWVGVSTTVVDDATLTRVYATEASTQLATVRLLDEETALPDELAQALFRRVSRHLAARNLPLGLTDTSSEFGPTRIPGYDAEIVRLEAPRKTPVVA